MEDKVVTTRGRPTSIPEYVEPQVGVRIYTYPMMLRWKELEGMSDAAVGQRLFDEYNVSSNDGRPVTLQAVARFMKRHEIAMATMEGPPQTKLSEILISGAEIGRDTLVNQIVAREEIQRLGLCIEAEARMLDIQTDGFGHAVLAEGTDEPVKLDDAQIEVKAKKLTLRMKAFELVLKADPSQIILKYLEIAAQANSERDKEMKNTNPVVLISRPVNASETGMDYTPEDTPTDGVTQ